MRFIFPLSLFASVSGLVFSAEQLHSSTAHALNNFAEHTNHLLFRRIKHLVLVNVWIAPSFALEYCGEFGGPVFPESYVSNMRLGIVKSWIKSGKVIIEQKSDSV